MKILSTKSIYYDDVNLIAQPNNILISRKDIPEEKWRIIVSPMPAVVGKTFANEALNLGLTVVLHRFAGIDNQIKIFNEITIQKDEERNSRLIGSVGLGDFKGVEKLVSTGFKTICIDIANGYLEIAQDFLFDLLGEYEDKAIFMVGNVHSADGIRLYEEEDVMVRVGIGNGNVCDTTNKATGFGRGQITELNDCSQVSLNSMKVTNGVVKGVSIIADGGIKNAACAAKAFGAGADFVMLGSYFANAVEAQNILDGEYKIWGCASDYNQEKFGTKTRHSEGNVKEIPHDKLKPLSVLVDELWGGISSAISYAGYRQLSDFIGNGVFEIKQ